MHLDSSPPPSEVNNTVFLRRTIAIVLIILVAVGLSALVLRLSDVLLIVFTCWLLSVALEIPIDMLRARGVSRTLSIGLVLAGVVVVLAVFILLIVPPIVTQIGDIATRLPTTARTVVQNYAELRDSVDLAGRFLPAYTAEEYDTLLSVLRGEAPADSLAIPGLPDGLNLDNLASSTVDVLGNVGTLVGNTVANLVLIFFVTLFIVIDPLVYYRAVIAMVPKHNEKRALEVLNAVRRTVTAWVGAMSISVLLTTILFSIMLSLVGVPNAIGLATIAGLATFVPVVGPTLAIIPVAIFAAADGLVTLVVAVSLYAGIGVLQDRIITPALMDNRLNVPAAGLLLFQLVVTVLFGPLGLLLAVPALAIGITLVRELFVRDVLDKPEGSVPRLTALQDGTLIFAENKDEAAAKELPPPQQDATEDKPKADTPAPEASP